MASDPHSKKPTANFEPIKPPAKSRVSVHLAERPLRELLSDLPKGSKLVKISLPPKSKP